MATVWASGSCGVPVRGLRAREWRRGVRKGLGGWGRGGWRVQVGYGVVSCALSGEDGGRGRSGRRRLDVLVLGNLCVDVRVDVQVLPSASSREEKRALYDAVVGCLHREESVRSASDDAGLVGALGLGQHTMEVGGSGNTAIASSRVGLSCGVLALHVPRPLDAAGEFVVGTMEEVGVELGRVVAVPGAPTPVCHVFVDPRSEHYFLGNFDFGEAPLLAQGGVENWEGLKGAAGQASLVYVNGFLYDEVHWRDVDSAVDAVVTDAGAELVVDLGPRAVQMRRGTWADAEERLASLWRAVGKSAVVLGTLEECVALLGGDAEGWAPEDVARALVDDVGAVWAAVKLGERGCVVAARDCMGTRVVGHPGFEVDVQDTVGCGDSFAAAFYLGWLLLREQQQQRQPDGGGGEGEDPERDPLRAVAALANAIGATTAGTPGAGRSVATVPMVTALLEEHAEEPEPPACALCGDPEGRADARAALALLQRGRARREGGGHPRGGDILVLS